VLVEKTKKSQTQFNPPFLCFSPLHLTYDNLFANHASFILSLQSHPEPTTYVEESKHECWKQEMQVELLSLEKTDTWDIMDLPPHGNQGSWTIKVPSLH